MLWGLIGGSRRRERKQLEKMSKRERRYVEQMRKKQKRARRDMEFWGSLVDSGVSSGFGGDGGGGGSGGC